MWDLVVVGAGPAGASAALAALQLRPGARVLLLDRVDFPRDKACGDGIATHAVDVLAGLGVDAIPSDPPVRRLRLGFVTELPVSREMQRPAYVVRRADFDARLASAARESGATLRRHQVRSLDIRADHVLVDGEPARVVIGADGANGVVRRLAGVPGPRAGTVALAIRGYAPVEPDCAGEQVITFAEHGWPAYAWSFPLGDGTANVGYGEVVTAGRSPGRAELIARLELLLPGAGAHATSWRAHHLPLSSGRPRQPDGRVLLAGDALSLVNPLTGEGIYYAVLSGACAGAAAVGWAGGRVGGSAASDPGAAGGDPRPGGDPGAAYRRELRGRLGPAPRATPPAGGPAPP